jgi:uncharacterized protein YdbL (DUF1318 family)
MGLAKALIGLAGMGLLAACVTINIYFPAAAAEKAADKIIQDVWGEQPGQGRPSAPQAKPPREGPQGSIPQDSIRVRGSGLFGIRAAHAQPDIDISSPAIRQVQASMKDRHGQLEPYYSNGTVGLTRDGLIAIRDLQAIPLAQRNQVKQLVSDENRDRKVLYREIAQANGHPEWEPQIRSTFARRWVANAASGWWYQDEHGGWTHK